MRVSLPLAALSLLGIAGCAPPVVKVGAPPPSTSPSSTSASPATPSGETGGGAPIEPALDNPGPLRLERLGRRLGIGDDGAAVREAFPKPEGAYEFDDLPARLRGSFESTGWEGRSEGFGAILYGGRVALAMRQFYEIDGARFDELLRNVRRANGGAPTETLDGRNAEFLFWETDGALLMVLRRGVKGNRYDMTVALGDKALMEAMEMSPAKAKGIVETLRADPDRKEAGDGAPTPRDPAPSTRKGGG